MRNTGWKTHLNLLQVIIWKNILEYRRYPMEIAFTFLMPIVWFLPTYFLIVSFAPQGTSIGLASWIGTDNFFSFPGFSALFPCDFAGNSDYLFPRHHPSAYARYQSAGSLLDGNRHLYYGLNVVSDNWRLAIQAHRPQVPDSGKSACALIGNYPAAL